jgi:hypothetical protein
MADSQPNATDFQPQATGFPSQMNELFVSPDRSSHVGVEDEEGESSRVLGGTGQRKRSQDSYWVVSPIKPN